MSKKKTWPGQKMTPDEERLGSYFPTCPECEARLVLRHGRNGPFFGCPWFPACRGTASIPEAWRDRL
jgi:ssDNA-binding Zn-finger/Zn-ribbon topoisomerase 1